MLKMVSSNTRQKKTELKMIKMARMTMMKMTELKLG